MKALLLLVAPAHLGAWGLESHRELTGLAISLLPEPLRPFFESRRMEHVEQALGLTPVERGVLLTDGYTA
jgi:hypothetical protein